MARTSMMPVVLGSAIALGASFAVTVALPTADAANTRHTDSTRAYSDTGRKGVEVYVNQGCVHCHTQQVRDDFTDSALAGRPTRAGDTLGDRPGELGWIRFGPDLACVGDRVPGGTEKDTLSARVDAMVAYLTEPSSMHAGSTMPSYAYLSDQQLRSLAAYLVALHCDQIPSDQSSAGAGDE